MGVQLAAVPTRRLTLSEPRQEVSVEDPLVSIAVLGEKFADASWNHASNRSATVTFVLASRPRSASLIISASVRWASRLPPRTVRYEYRCLPVTES